MIIGLCSLAVAPAAASPGHQGAARGRVFIHEIFYNSPGSDNGSNSSLNAEWVDLRNSSGHPITLTHWTLRDKAGHVYKFMGTFRLRAHKDVMIHTGRGSDTRTNRFWGRRAYVWNNDGDTAVLKSPSGSLKSRCTYSDPSERHASVIC
jgi:Lamin Tail Domain